MPLKLYRRGKVWHYRGTVAGRLLRGSTKTASKETAQRIAANAERQAWDGHFDPKGVITFAQAAILDTGRQSDRIGSCVNDLKTIGEIRLSIHH